MDNYFEEETCNLDKVLDEFEKNEDETVSSRLLDAKWNQILDTPSLRLADHSELDNVSKSFITIEAHLKVGSPNLLSPPMSPCCNGEIGCVSLQSAMVAGDNMADTQLDDCSVHSECVLTNARFQGSTMLNSAEDTENQDFERSVLKGNSLSSCKSPTNQSLMDALYLTLDTERPDHHHLNITENNQQPGAQITTPDADCSVDDPHSVNTKTNTLSPIQTQKGVNTNTGPHDPCIASGIILSSGSVVISDAEGYDTSRISTFSTKNNNGQLGDLDVPHSPPLDAQKLNSSSPFCADMQLVNVARTEKVYVQSVDIVTDNDNLHSSASSNLMVEHFENSCVINGEFNKTSEKQSTEMDGTCQPSAHCHVGVEHKELVDTNVILNSSIEDAEGPNHTEDDGTNVLHNGDDSYGMQNPTISHNPKNLPSKEDSVTEEKEIEESKSEYYSNVYEQQRDDEVLEGSRLVLNTVGDQMKNHLHSLCGQVLPAHGHTSPKQTNSVQSVSVPFGGARPKQPTHLKLQIPKPLSEMLQSDLVPPNAGCSLKNKNDLLNKSNQSDNLISDSLRNEAPLCSPVADANSELLIDSSVPGSPCLALSPESPDNDLLAGHFGIPTSKPFNTLGEVAPVWVPDSQAPNCMKCEAKFTFTKRRHHCRACGKVFCAACCSLKCKLLYMDKKEARVCVICHSVLIKAQALENRPSTIVQSPNPNNPAEYCSTIPPMQQAQASGALSSPPLTVMVPVGVLKHPGVEVSQCREQRRVWFADGILPNGEAADASKASGAPAAGTLTMSQDASKSSPSCSPTSEAENTSGFCGSVTQVGSAMNLIPEDGLPPILISTGVKGDYAVEERPSQMCVMQQLEDGGSDPLVFVLNANLLAMVKIVNYVNRKCWCFTTKGMHAVGQAEIVILLQCQPDEKCLPRDLFSHFVELYREAMAGNVVGNLGHSFFSQTFLGSKEHGGFLYVTPTYQSLQDLVLPAQPYLFGILIQKWETPWAKVFPIRLMLRLGAEYRLYPCPLFSVRFRKPLFGETGHTIINVLADFRNYQYTLPVVQGLVVDMEVKKTSIKIPSNRYNEMMKAMNKSNEHVLAGGACFNQKADSHLVCVQNDDGNYQTQAISIHKQPRKVTGASFFVFSGALKASSGFLAKSSIVEDGVMVQITAESMDALRQALREMKDFTITCGKADAEETQEHVYVQWVEDDKNFNKGVSSPIDGKLMESVTSVKIFHGSEYKANGKVIRWTEVFFLESEEQQSGLSDPADHSRLTENLAKAFCLALCPHLKLLKEDGMTRLGLRVTLDSDQVGYQAGSNGQPLPARYTNDLDSALVPVIHGSTCQLNEGPVTMELLFYILENIS
ncbi:zinc finger FYVE domain-containing protein 9 [Bombina bombina]|uniref:zinc finger FYVE domain-containing protein 9 n=1 Tax=Bombina bombina TaxID=8345 RepID=UPI00235A998C|nr:zinc finger FYVE domain-containing protein 9 [Bombina bombina]XP_053549453.1 zinc finger FYVE domain-containing protein 9 [Bombina bombina]XP_053549454.1 zinc finger FYVE domain-containing protein 9 [Bombina bombina]